MKNIDAIRGDLNAFKRMTRAVDAAFEILENATEIEQAAAKATSVVELRNKELQELGERVSEAVAKLVEVKSEASTLLVQAETRAAEIIDSAQRMANDITRGARAEKTGVDAEVELARVNRDNLKAEAVSLAAKRDTIKGEIDKLTNSITAIK